MKAKDRKTKKSRAVGYGTFGKSVLASRPKKVIVNTVVIPEKYFVKELRRLQQLANSKYAYPVKLCQRSLHDLARRTPKRERPEVYKGRILG